MTKSACAALISLGLLASCAPPAATVSIPVAGGQRIRFEKVGSSFGRAEDSRFVITESGLTTYREGGRNYLRWQFGFRVKQPVKLQSVVVEEVSGTQPVLILKDLAPQVAGIEWIKQSGLTPAEPGAVPWFFDPGSTLRIFRFSINEADGQRSTLYQAALFDRKAKDALRYQMGPEVRAVGRLGQAPDAGER